MSFSVLFAYCEYFQFDKWFISIFLAWMLLIITGCCCRYFAFVLVVPRFSWNLLKHFRMRLAEPRKEFSNISPGERITPECSSELPSVVAVRLQNSADVDMYAWCYSESRSFLHIKELYLSTFYMKNHNKCILWCLMTKIHWCWVA